ncbi:MAG: antitermination protein NusB, partial [Prochlorococcus sp.]
MQSRSLARELALLVLGQIPEGDVAGLKEIPLESLLQKALDGLTQLWREDLDSCAEELERAQQQLLDSDIQDPDSHSKPLPLAREHLQSSLTGAERVLNG